MANESPAVLWVDDDANGLLSPLHRILQRSGLKIETATSFVEGMERLTNNKYSAVLLDIILPYAEGAGALASDLGLTLAERCVTSGVKVVAFLTVLRLDEVIDKYNELVNTYLDTKFTYFDKATLLEQDQIETLIGYLADSKSCDS